MSFGFLTALSMTTIADIIRRAASLVQSCNLHDQESDLRRRTTNVLMVYCRGSQFLEFLDRSDQIQAVQCKLMQR